MAQNYLKLVRAVGHQLNPYATEFGQYKMRQRNWKITETLANGYSSGSTQRDLSNEYQHDRDYMVIKNLCIIVPWTKVSSALEGLMIQLLTALERKKQVLCSRCAALEARPMQISRSSIFQQSHQLPLERNTGTHIIPSHHQYVSITLQQNRCQQPFYSAHLWKFHQRHLDMQTLPWSTIHLIVPRTIKRTRDGKVTGFCRNWL